MKLFSSVAGAAILLMFSVCAKAQMLTGSSPHYAVTISAVASTQLSSGSTAAIHSVPVTNGSILNAIVATGTSGVNKASDLDIVFDGESLDLSVINKATKQIVVVIGSEGGDYNVNAAIEAAHHTAISVVGAVSGYAIMLPDASEPYDVNEVIRYVSNPKQGSEGLASISISFFGGIGDGEAGSVFIQGTAKKAKNVYYY